MAGYIIAGAVLLALALVGVTAPVLGPIFNRLIWFFTCHVTIWPVAMVLPLFEVLGVRIPVLSCCAAANILWWSACGRNKGTKVKI